MEFFICSTIGQLLLLLFLIAEDKNDGEKELFREQKWKASDVWIVVLSIRILELLLYYLATFHFMYHVMYPLFFQNNPHVSHYFLFFLFIFIFLVALVKFRFKQNIKILGFKKNNLKKNIGLGIAVALISYLISVAFDLLVGTDVSSKEIAKEIRNLKDLLEYVLYFFLIIILVPVVEESIYRGILYSPYRKKYGPKKAILITALFFSIIHIKVGFGLIFIDSILLGILYEKTESIVAPIVAHSIYNLLGTLTAFYLFRAGGYI